jgi:hypothetical protein
MTIRFETKSFDHLIAVKGREVEASTIGALSSQQVKKDISHLLKNKQIKTAVKRLAAE